MASAYGIIHNYGEPQSMFDAGLALQALQHKQQKYDANTIKIEQTLNQYGMRMNDLARPEDREYLYNRLNNLVNNIHGLKDNTDIGNNSVTQGIIGHINQALDPYVVEQLGISKNIQNFQNTVSTIQQEDPEKYNSLNYQAAVIGAGLQDYMSGKTDGLKKPLNYTPYNDFNTEITNKIKAAKDIMGSQTVELVDPNDPSKVIRTTTDNMTRAQWLQYMPNLITSQNMAQMRIDGAARYGFSDEAALNSKKEMLAATTEPIQDKINKINDQLLNSGENLTPEQKKDLKAERDRYKSLKTQTEAQYDQVGTTAESIGGYVVRQGVMQSLSNIAGSDPSRYIEKNPSYEATKNNKQANALNPLSGTHFAETNMPLSREQLEDFSVSDIETNAERAETKYENLVNTTYENLGTQAINTANGKKLPTDIVSNYTEEVLAENEGLSTEDARSYALEKYYTTFKPTGWMETKNGIVEARRQRDMQNSAINEAFAEVTGKKLWEDNSDGIYEAMTEIGFIDNIKINGVDTRDYLNNKGINSKEQFSRFLKTPESKELKTALYTDYLVAHEASGKSFINGLLNNQPMSVNKETYNYYKRLAETTGIDEDFTETFNVTVNNEKIDETTLLENVSSGVRYNIEINTDSEVGSIINKRIGETIRIPDGGAISRSDMSFYTDSYIQEAFSYEKYTEDFKNALNTSSIGVTTPKKLTINMPLTSKEAGTAYNELKMAASNSSNPGAILIGYGEDQSPVDVFVSPSDPNNIVISQTIFPTNAEIRKAAENNIPTDDDDYPKPIIQTSTINRQEFNAMAPSLSAQIRSESVTGQLRFGANDSFEVDDITYPQHNPKIVKGYVNFLQDPDLADAATYQGAQQVLKRRTPNIYNTQNFEIKSVMDYSLNHPEKFKVSYEEEDGTRYVDVMIDTGGGQYERLGMYDVSNKSPETIKRTLNVAPQAFVTMAMVGVGVDLSNGDPETFNTLREVYTKRQQ